MAVQLRLSDTVIGISSSFNCFLSCHTIRSHNITWWDEELDFAQCSRNLLCHAQGYQQKFQPKIQFLKLFEINLKLCKYCTTGCIYDIKNKILQKKSFSLSFVNFALFYEICPFSLLKTHFRPKKFIKRPYLRKYGESEKSKATLSSQTLKV